MTVERRDSRKPYRKPVVTRVKLSVEHNVLQGCHSNLPNPTGAPDAEACWTTEFCLKAPPG